MIQRGSARRIRRRAARAGACARERDPGRARPGDRLIGAGAILEGDGGARRRGQGGEGKAAKATAEGAAKPEKKKTAKKKQTAEKKPAKKKPAKKKPTAKERGRYRVTYPNGRKGWVDDTSGLPAGTMVEWDEPDTSGRPTMHWTIVGGGWPFDD